MTKDINARLKILDETFQEEDFLLNKGLGNEVGYYIFDYHPAEELLVREHIKLLQENSDLYKEGYELKVFNLYHIMIDYLRERQLLSRAEKFEKHGGIEEVTTKINRLLKMDGKEQQNYFVEYIEERTPEKAIVILTGIGELYPLIRAHSILNKMHQVFDRVPVVMMYPGEYDKLKLTIFNTNKDDNYYRAFRIG
ncbi:DUF1788 domain-containing protein [Vagococcus salmoninarum]|uniref:DUF1788 domain-containing protein n=1 Tax=Vagococcus salmoninarum TaxID=2739 RepID=UPI003F9A9306